MVFTKILGFVTPIIFTIFEKIAEKLNREQEKEKEYGYISLGLTIVCWIYSFVNIFCADGVIFSALVWLQEHWWVTGIYILFAAVLPSVTAQKERKNGTFEAKEDYAVRNRKFNLSGAVASCAVFGLIYSVVGDFRCLKFFYIEDLVPLIASVSVWMAIIYQKIERKKYKELKLDHDPTLNHMNQKLNLLHLFNVYFLAIVSVVYLVSYTIYCRKYHIDIVIHPITYFILITVALWFFYKLSQHEHRYLYTLSIIFIPVILISSVYWMTWFTLSQEMRFWQWLFVFVHTMIYVFCIFKKENVICVRRYNDKENGRGIKIGKWVFLSENYFLLVLPVVVAIIYIIAWELPLFIDRLPANEAYNYIDMICEDTDVDADEVIEKVENQEIYNETDETYDIEAFMRFLSEELGEQLLEKGIIETEGSVPTRDVLQNRLINAERDKDV
ncbi:MAG: hypothetical protein K2N15_05320 [Lachnospiraceae bacterium]|nr:hypothetical protein [Lachnospiraceae bacterium]